MPAPLAFDHPLKGIVEISQENRDLWAFCRRCHTGFGVGAVLIAHEMDYASLLISTGDGLLGEDLTEIGVPSDDIEIIRRRILSFHSIDSLRIANSTAPLQSTVIETAVSHTTGEKRRLKAALLLQRNFRGRQGKYALYLRFMARKQILDEVKRRPLQEISARVIQRIAVAYTARKRMTRTSRASARMAAARRLCFFWRKRAPLKR